LFAAFFVAGWAQAQVNLSKVPLFLTSSADPNIMFSLDDSGSMHWEITPDDAKGASNYIFPLVPGMYGGSDYANQVPSPRWDSANANEATTARAQRSASFNKSYYNPGVTYRPWANADGTLMPASNPAAARHHPTRNLGTLDLTANLTATALWVSQNGPTNPASFCAVNPCTQPLTYFPATYFTYNGGAVWDQNSYARVQIIATTPTYTGEGRINRTDCLVGVCTYAQEIQNFANWYTFYRSRMLSSQGAIGTAFSRQSDRMRVGFAAINKGSESIDGVNTRVVIRGVRPFSGASRTDFFDRLYNGVWEPANTPLRAALDSVGQYFSRPDNRGPWGAVPGTDDPTAHLSCRQSFNILMTDGYWNNGQGEAGTAGARANVDGTAGGTITGPNNAPFTYTPRSPFSDDRGDTLADVGMYYWRRDLRTNLDNRVPTSDANPAFWQHMVTFGVGLGVTGSVTPTLALSGINSPTAAAITWPDPTASNPAKIDDLLHAGVNSRGGFFSATDPQTFADRLSETLEAIVARAAGSGAAAAASSAILQSDTLLYAASFNSDDWSGNLRAVQLDPTTGAVGTLTWEAQRSLANRSTSTVDPNRNLFTTTSDATGVGVPLQWASLGAAQRTALGINPPGVPATTATSLNRLNWLRGVDQPGLRNRVVVETVNGIQTPAIRRLGDLVSSDPVLMSKTDFAYGSYLTGVEGSSYRTFRNTAAYRARPDTLFVGSNGGMLHAFHAGTPFVTNTLAVSPANVPDPRGGEELFAYVPKELLLPGTTGIHAQINELMRPDYRSNRRYFVDGSSSVTDAYTGPAGSKTWKSVLVGTMGAGGRTVFALDVTNPLSFDVSNVMWEFGYAPVACTPGVTACEDMGYGITQPKVVRLRNGAWVAIFGNGYNSASHRAKLMIVDLSTGQLIRALDTGVGSAAALNGLAAPEVTDWPSSDLLVSRVYAGDLRGNLWRFDLTDPASPVTARLFSGAATRPITARPSIALDPDAPGRAVVVVGTGSYFRVGDGGTSGVTTQTIYGIYDSSATSVVNTDRTDLGAQTITANATDVTLGAITYAAGQLRTVSQNALTATQKGWRIDLPAAGELVWREASFVEGFGRSRVRISTLVPEPDPCGNGRTGFRMDIDLLTGGASTDQVWDLSGDGAFTSADGGYSGIKRGTGEPQVSVRAPDRNTDKNFAGDGMAEPDSQNRVGPAGRQTWRQIR
jgi:type IV pilus assembly protein PilY1